MRVRKLGKRGMDLEFSTSSGVDVRILERPGRWMPADEQQDLIRELRAVARRGTDGNDLTYGVLSADGARIDNAVITVLSDATSGDVFGFSAMSLLPVRVWGRKQNVLHLGLVVLGPEARGRGFARLVYGVSLVVALLRRRFRPFWVSNVTQVPAIVGMVAETLTDAYPAPGNDHGRTEEHAEVARQIMARHRSVFGVGEEAGFDPDRFIITNAYTGGSDHLKKSFAAAPKHRNPAFDELCRDRLDYDRGDDFLQLARFTPRVAARCLSHFVLRSSIVAPAFRTLAPAFRMLASLSGSVARGVRRFRRAADAVTTRATPLHRGLP